MLSLHEREKAMDDSAQGGDLVMVKLHLKAAYSSCISGLRLGTNKLWSPPSVPCAMLAHELSMTVQAMCRLS